MKYTQLAKINSPADLKKLSMTELSECAVEIRALITQTVLKNGGHLASSLGAVELCLALHRVYDAPHDKILFDVGHQAYAHKIVTGRRDMFTGLRADGGISGFMRPQESPYDAFVSGHASNSLSAALGYCRARLVTGQGYQVAAVIGDGALTGGMAFEALNDIGAENADTVIVLNDNEMSISKNVGAMSRYFSRLRISKGYLQLKSRVRRAVSALPFFGDQLVRMIEKGKDAIRLAFRAAKMFEQMGIRYYGPFDGNRLDDVISVLRQAKQTKGPVLVHLLTKKGCGFADAEQNPSRYHGLMPHGYKAGESFGLIAGKTLCELAGADGTVCAITAAMTDGTGLGCFSNQYSARYFDVGIAESHAVTMAAGLAAGGAKPYVCIYSSFLQRGFDQILHDVCIPNLPVTFLIDRAGAVDGDGVTHQGTFDLSYLSMIPNLTILTPKDGEELREMILFSRNFGAPLAIRYPKFYTKSFGFCQPVAAGKWEVLGHIEPQKQNPVCYILAAGSRMAALASETNGVTVVNCRSIKPIDTEFLDSVGQKGATLITLEDNVLTGGFGVAVLQYMNQKGFGSKVYNLGFGDMFIPTHSAEFALFENGLTKENVQRIIDSLA